MIKALKLKRNLVLFTLSYDLEDPILSHVVNWAIHFALYFERVEVYAVHVGKFPKTHNIHVSQIGGGDFLSRLLALIRLIQICIRILGSKSNPAIFYLMNEKVAAVLSPILSLRGLNQALWYSHSRKSIFLSIAERYCNVIFSPTEKSFPINSSKLVATGHGIDLNKFRRRNNFEQREKRRILILGRVSRIKNIDLAIKQIALVNFQVNENFSLDLAGPILDEKYFGELNLLASSHNVSIKHIGVIDPDNTPELLNRYQMVFVGNPRTIDKVGVEAAIVGCLVLTEVPELFVHLELSDIYISNPKRQFPPRISEQILVAMSNGAKLKDQLHELSSKVSRRNDLAALVERISIEIGK